MTEHTIRFEWDSKETLRVVDTLSHDTVELSLDGEGAPEEHSTEPFEFPVERAISIESSSLVINDNLPLFVRDTEGSIIDPLVEQTSLFLEPGRYLLDAGARVKLYFLVDGSATLTMEHESIQVDFEVPQRLVIGARSTHLQPQFTIGTPDEPRYLFEAISTFGSGLKTQSPERSFPTLRGHPPLLKRDNQLTIPDDLETPTNGIEIRLPPTRSNAFTVAPVAYYLGATVVPDEEPRIETESGWRFSLDDGASVATSLGQVLRQVFLLECATRTGGLYPVELSERQVIEDRVELSFSALYDAPPGERIEAFLDVPYETVEDQVPTWPAWAKVSIPDSPFELIPHLTNEMAIIDPIEGGASSELEPPSVPVAQHIWFGQGLIPSLSKGFLEAYEHRLQLKPRENISVAIVLNDSSLVDETAPLKDEYASEGSLPFEVSIFNELTCAELADILRQPFDLLHFVGHTEEEGFECTDGLLDAADVTDTKVPYFFLNSCSSFTQASRLIENGSVAGIATVADVNDRSAAWFGVTLGRLLNIGYPLHAAIAILDGETLLDERYVLLGAGSTDLTPPESVPFTFELRRNSEEPLQGTLTYFHSERLGIGSMGTPFLGDTDQFTIIPSTTDWEATSTEVMEMFARERAPVRIDEEFHWSDTVDSLKSM